MDGNQFGWIFGFDLKFVRHSQKFEKLERVVFGKRQERSYRDEDIYSLLSERTSKDGINSLLLFFLFFGLKESLKHQELQAIKPLKGDLHGRHQRSTT